jgi:MFS transporter, ACS family, hexuronate transporter
MLTDPISYFFVFWTPLYLQQERGFDLAAIGMYSWIPFLALALGNLAGGAVPGLLMRFGWSLSRSRKTTMFVSSCFVTVSCLAIARSGSPALAITLISAAMFCHASWANMTLPAELLPRSMIGSVTGIAGAMGGIMGILSQQLIGWTVEHVSFTPVFTVCSFLHLIAFGLVCLLGGTLGTVAVTRPAHGA